MSVFRRIMLSGGGSGARKIYYTATSEITPSYSLRNIILTHEYDSNTGKGVIVTTEDITEIGDYAFYNCASLTSITIPNSVTSIGNAAFQYCESLTSITIPNSVTSIGNEAFFGCTSLPVIDGIRYADLYLVEVVDKTMSAYSIQPGTKFVSNYAFSECSSTKSIIIPNGVTSIGGAVFSNCTSLTSIIIPGSVNEIE